MSVPSGILSDPFAAALTPAIIQHPLPHWMVHPASLHILYANAAASRAYGYTAAEMTTLRFSQLFSDTEAVPSLQLLTEEGQGGKTYLHQKKDHGIMAVQLFACRQVMGKDELLLITAVPGEQNLGRQIKNYQTTIEKIPSGVYCIGFHQPPSIHDPGGIVASLQEQAFFVECNTAMARMHGFERSEDLVGKKVAEYLNLTDPEHLSYFQSFAENGFKKDHALPVERARNGESIYFLNNVTGIVENDRLKRIWCIQKDVGELKSTEEKLMLLARMVEETSDLLTAADLQFIPITWNKAAERLYGIPAQSVIGRPVRDLLTIHYQNASREEVRRQVLENGEWRGEMYFIRPTDQQLVTLLGSFKLLKDATGKPCYIIANGTDITQRKNAEQKLKESENRFREVAGSAPMMIWMTDENGICTYVNDSWVNFTGTDPLFTDREQRIALVHPDDLAACLATIAQHEPQKQPYQLEYRLRSADGGFRWVKDACNPRFLANKVFVGYIGSLVDIDDQKRREQVLRHQADILENISDVVTTSDLQFHITSINKAGEQAYGQEANYIIGKRLSQFITSRFINSSLEQCIEELSTNGIWEGEVAITQQDGTLIYFLHHIKEFFDSNGKKIGYLSIGKDITERRKMEKRLQKSEQFYRSLIADSLNGTLLLDASATITFASPAVHTLLGYRPEEVVGKNGFGYVDTEDLVWAKASFLRELEENPQMKSITIRLRKKDGSWLWCNVRGHNMLSVPHVQSVVIYFHDDSVRKQANDALKLSEKRFRSLISDLNLGLFMASADGRITLCNPMLCTMLRLPESEIVGKTVDIFFSTDLVDENDQPFSARQMLLAHLFTQHGIKDVVVGLNNPLSGERSWIMINTKPITDDAGAITHAICTLKDVTRHKESEKKRLAQNIQHQRQLTQATIDGQEKERREIGRELHDNIGQQLTTIKLFLDMLKNEAGAESSELINMSLKGVSDAINEVRSMSHALVPYSLKDLGLVESVHELIENISRTQSLRVELQLTHFDEDRVPENQQLTLYRIIQEQLNNICKHAGASSALIQLQLHQQQVLLKISDNGKGFDPQTTKKGLGLTNIRNRAELFGGRATIVSELDYGTLVSVSIPLMGNEE